MIIDNSQSPPEDPSTLVAPPGTVWKQGRKSVDDFGVFQAISELSTVLSPRKIIPDIFDRLALVSAPAVKLFAEMKEHRDYRTGRLVYEHNFKKPSHRTRFYQKLKELKDQEIIKRIKVSNEYIKVRKHTYLINPYLIKPLNYSEAIELWNKL
jgi:hypothetical protein